MSRLRHMDVALELIELCNELRDEVRQQLLYYRASVYKQETAAQINKKVDHLRLVASLFSDDNLFDIFDDYDAMVSARQQSPIPGECSLSFRVSHLIEILGRELNVIKTQAYAQSDRLTLDAIAENLVSHRQELLTICKYGSRPWNILQSM